MKRSKIVNGVEFEDISGYGNYPYYNPKTQSTFTKASKYADWRVDDVDKLTRDQAEDQMIIFLYPHLM